MTLTYYTDLCGTAWSVSMEFLGWSVPGIQSVGEQIKKKKHKIKKNEERKQKGAQVSSKQQMSCQACFGSMIGQFDSIGRHFIAFELCRWEMQIWFWCDTFQNVSHFCVGILTYFLSCLKFWLCSQTNWMTERSYFCVRIVLVESGRLPFNTHGGTSLYELYFLLLCRVWFSATLVWDRVCKWGIIY